MGNKNVALYNLIIDLIAKYQWHQGILFRAVSFNVVIKHYTDPYGPKMSVIVIV